MKKQRKYYTPEEKSPPCGGIYFYRWQKEFFEIGRLCRALQQRPPEQCQRQQEIHAERDRKLGEARKQQQVRRQQGVMIRRIPRSEAILFQMSMTASPRHNGRSTRRWQ
jgi:hypothetical protein